MSGKNVVQFNREVSQPSTQESDRLAFQPDRPKRPQRVAVASEEKILVSRVEAARLLSISQRALDYLVASKRLPTRRIGSRVLIPIVELRKYARCDHPERIVS
jgi:excisionase family DNA binding protein